MRAAKPVLGIVFCCMTAGCVSVPTPPQTALGLADFRVYRRDMVQPKAGTQEIIFLRDHGLGAGPSLAILDVNREPIASVEKGERVSVWLAPGNYRIGVRQGLDESSTAVRSELELKVERQMQYAFRIRYGTRFEILPLDRVAVGTAP